MDARRLSSTAAEWAESVHGLSDVLWIDTALLIIICVLVGFVVYRMTFSAGESAAAAAPTEQSALIGEKKPAEEGNAEGASAAAEESGAAAADEKEDGADAAALAAGGEDKDAQASCWQATNPFAQSAHHHRQGVYGTTHGIEDTSDDDESVKENMSWRGASVKWTPVIVKGLIATLLAGFSGYIVYDGINSGEVNYSDMRLFKDLAFALSVVLTLPQLYQTTLMSLRRHLLFCF